MIDSFIHLFKKLTRPLPRLSRSARESIAKKLWIVAAIFTVIAIVAVAQGATMFFKLSHIVTGTVLGSLVQILYVNIIISTILSVALAVFYARSIMPLRARQKHGWDNAAIGTIAWVAQAVAAFIFAVFISVSIRSTVLATPLIGLLLAIGFMWVILELEDNFQEQEASQAKSLKAKVSKSSKK